MIFWTFIENILAVFLILLLGILISRKWQKSDWIDPLNSFAYYIALPSLLLTSLWKMDFAQVSPNFFLLNYFAIFLGIASAFSLFKILRFKYPSILSFSAIFGNVAYLGIPLTILLFGKEYVGVAAIASFIYTSFLPLYIFAFEGKIKIESIRNPILLSVICGLVLNLLKIPKVAFLFNAIKILGDSAPGVALFALGLWIGVRGIKIKRNVIALCLYKLIVLPTIFLLLYFSGTFTINETIFKIALLEATMPLAITNFVFAKKYGKLAEEISSAIVLTTFASLLTATIFILAI